MGDQCLDAEYVLVTAELLHNLLRRAPDVGLPILTVIPLSRISIIGIGSANPSETPLTETVSPQRTKRSVA